MAKMTAKQFIEEVSKFDLSDGAREFLEAWGDRVKPSEEAVALRDAIVAYVKSNPKSDRTTIALALDVAPTKITPNATILVRDGVLVSETELRAGSNGKSKAVTVYSVKA